MSMRTWLSRSIGRTREGTKQHLVGTAELLGCGPAVLSAMRQANDEQCEAMLVDHVEKTCGGTADWREHTKDVAETICAFLAPEEAALLQHLSLDDHARPHEAAAQLDKLLAGTAKGVRALDTFGDFYILVVVPRTLLAQFDDINKYWLATTTG
jgi:hypothetical protein